MEQEFDDFELYQLMTASRVAQPNSDIPFDFTDHNKEVRLRFLSHPDIAKYIDRLLPRELIQAAVEISHAPETSIALHKALLQHKDLNYRHLEIIACKGKIEMAVEAFEMLCNKRTSIEGALKTIVSKGRTEDLALKALKEFVQIKEVSPLCLIPMILTARGPTVAYAIWEILVKRPGFHFGHAHSLRGSLHDCPANLPIFEAMAILEKEIGTKWYEEQARLGKVRRKASDAAYVDHGFVERSGV